MKRIITLYNKIYNWKLATFGLALVVMISLCVDQIIDKQKYSTKYELLSSHYLVFDFIWIILSFLLVLLYQTIIQHYKENNRDLIHWLAMSKLETIILEVMCVAPWIISGNQISYVVFKLLIHNFDKFGIMWYLIIILGSILLSMIKIVPLKRKFLINQTSIGKRQNPNYSLVCISLRERMRNLKFIGITIVFIISSFALYFVPHNELLKICLFIVIIFISDIEDFYWSEKSKSFDIYKVNAIPFYKFLLIELLSALFIWCIPFFLLLLPILQVDELFLFIFLLLWVLLYWENVYIYIGQLHQGPFGYKNLLCIVFMIMMCIPIAGIGLYFYLMKKNERMWRNGDIN